MPSTLVEILQFAGLILWNLFKATWWVIVPFYLFSKVHPLYLRNKRSQYSKKLDWIVLEVSLPPDVLKTPKAMENVLEGLHGVWSPLTSREKWTEGVVIDRFSLEMVGTAGRLHFYIRCKRSQRNFVESKVYSQYSDAAIEEVPDYTADLPADVPGESYEVWGAEYTLNRSWVYPIRTYIEFEDLDEDRRMDPISQYAELVSKMEEGEHMWMQVVISPVLSEVEGKAKSEIDKLVGRDSGTKYVDPLTSIFNAFGGGGQKKKPEKTQSDMTRMTPGERMNIEKIEIKDSKIKFNTMLRAVYVARKDVWHGEHLAGLHGYLRQFSGLNSFRPHSGSFPKGSLILFKKFRNYIRKRNILAAYKGRYLDFATSPYVLSTEEIATMYHFPGRVVRAPLMPRVPSRTSEPPSGLPT
ncbi:MAG: hypothetical protein WDZ40_03830 [Candidatus Spechtbacterales bacterium]